ncbi:TFIIH p62 subunit, N-terminal domain-containing protein [Papiliotrema laurentii]|uniref:TFIIH p62 subunit, N-terminal domain-containing protein n=1 Tax=Papiliotrema laurentii TaxID=5418 RepID=A0AAD9D152_PAPLA|nr:TFIIH p62 subunit, N-terminal domain-containing protein [Papiliotrema laurentii]
MSGENVQRFAADFKKVPGVLSITETHIAWNANTPGAMDRQYQALNRITNMLASKAGAAKVSLKLLFKDDLPAGGLLFTFTNPTAQNRESDRLIVQDLLIPFVSANKGITPLPGSTSTPAAAATPAASASVPGTPAAVVGTKRKLQDEAAGSVGADSPAPSTGSGAGGMNPAKQKQMDHLRKMKMRVLEKNPTLAALYRELVWQPDDPSIKISEKEFWSGREALIRAEEAAQAQKPGRQPRLIDDRFALGNSKSGGGGIGGTGKGVKTKDEGGPQIFSLRPEDIKQIFEEFPVVADAYAKYVPSISETEFWTRYFQSQLWEQQRASERRTVNDESAKKKDDIFDQYLEDPDWNIQPKEKLPDHIERFLDLSATEEDHGETSTQRDPTMQAGRERGALPLIRRFNANAARLSKTGQSAAAAAASSSGGYLNTALPDDVNIYDEIDLEDLRGPAVQETITLEVPDPDRPDGGDSATKRGVLPQKTDEELAALGEEYANTVLGYTPTFGNVSLPTPPGGWEKNRIESGSSAEQAAAFRRFQAQKLGAEAAAQVVKEMHLASNAENAVNAPLPEVLFEQMRSCHNAATEFLRQYWSALLPLPAGALGSGGPAVIPKNKEARDPTKAAKMAKYLAMTERKMDAVVQTAVIAGIDAARVRAALAPTLGAVNVALAREAARLAGAS